MGQIEFIGYFDSFHVVKHIGDTMIIYMFLDDQNFIKSYIAVGKNQIGKYHHLIDAVNNTELYGMKTAIITTVMILEDISFFIDNSNLDLIEWLKLNIKNRRGKIFYDENGHNPIDELIGRNSYYIFFHHNKDIRQYSQLRPYFGSMLKEAYQFITDESLGY